MINRVCCFTNQKYSCFYINPFRKEVYTTYCHVSTYQKSIRLTPLSCVLPCTRRSVVLYLIYRCIFSLSQYYHHIMPQLLIKYTFLIKFIFLLIITFFSRCMEKIKVMKSIPQILDVHILSLIGSKFIMACFVFSFILNAVPNILFILSLLNRV